MEQPSEREIKTAIDDLYNQIDRVRVARRVTAGLIEMWQNICEHPKDKRHKESHGGKEVVWICDVCRKEVGTVR